MGGNSILEEYQTVKLTLVGVILYCPWNYYDIEIIRTKNLQLKI